MVASDSVLLSLCLKVEDEASDARSRLSALQARISLNDFAGCFEWDEGEGRKGGGGTEGERGREAQLWGRNATRLECIVRAGFRHFSLLLPHPMVCLF